MKAPIAFDITTPETASEPPRKPRAFALDEVAELPAAVESYSDPSTATEDIAPRLAGPNWLVRILLGAAGLLLSLGIGLALDSLIANLFATQPWLGWLALAVTAIFVIAVIALVIREWGAVWRLRRLDHLRNDAEAAFAADDLKRAKAILAALDGLYASRPDLGQALARSRADSAQFFDGADLLNYAERTLMAPLDSRARALTASAARRVALVTAVSPRALVDVAFVIWESVRLGAAIARLYGARPGLLGTWRLFGAILGHLAVTGGLVLTDGLIEQLVGQGLAARLSQRLGEGVVNGLMTVRVGIAAMRVVRPLPFKAQPQPLVREFVPELANVLKSAPKD